MFPIFVLFHVSVPIRNFRSVLFLIPEPEPRPWHMPDSLYPAMFSLVLIHSDPHVCSPVWNRHWLSLELTIQTSEPSSVSCPKFEDSRRLVAQHISWSRVLAENIEPRYALGPSPAHNNHVKHQDNLHCPLIWAMAHFRMLDHAYKVATVAKTMSVVSAHPHILGPLVSRQHREESDDDVERESGQIHQIILTRLFSTLKLSWAQTTHSCLYDVFHDVTRRSFQPCPILIRLDAVGLVSVNVLLDVGVLHVGGHLSWC